MWNFAVVVENYHLIFPKDFSIASLLIQLINLLILAIKKKK